MPSTHCVCVLLLEPTLRLHPAATKRVSDARQQAGDVRLAPPVMPVERGARRRPDPDQHLAVGRHGPGRLGDAQLIGCAVGTQYIGPHRILPGHLTL